MESKGTFFILIIVVAVLTLTLAALAGYLFLVQGTDGGKAADNQGTVVKEVPKEEDLSTKELYDGKKYFNLKSEDPERTAIIQVDIAFKYFNEIKDDKKIKVAEKVDFYLWDIKELVSTYFMNVTMEDVKLPDAREKAKEELKKQINDLLNEGSKVKHEYVYKVIIGEWLYQ